jgi:cytoskeleton protein RodZ
MKTKTVGEILKDQREQHRLSLEEMAKVTRIRTQYLSALEANRFHDLPAAAFVRGYIRSYAQAFGFDHKPILALLRRDYKEGVQGRLVPQAFIRPVARRRLVWAPMSLTVMSFFIVLLVISSYVGYQWFQLQQPPALTINEPSALELVGAEVVVRGQTIPDGVVAINTQPVALDIDGQFEHVVQFEREGLTTLRVEVVDRRGKRRTIERQVNVRF